MNHAHDCISGIRIDRIWRHVVLFLVYIVIKASLKKDI